MLRCLRRAALTLAGLVVAFHVCALEIAQVAKQVLERSEAFREGEGLRRHEMQPELAAAAGEFARYMASSGRYGHTADARTPAQRATAHGYDYCIVLENIGYVYRSRGYSSADAVAEDLVEGWKKSPEHRAAMLDAAATQTGVGIARDDSGRYFGVQMFGRPKRAAIRFSVANSSGTAIDYRTGERVFSLPPRATREHIVCRPVTLQITLPGKAQPQAIRASDGATYTVTHSAIVRSP